MYKEITSIQNSTIKGLLQLQEKSRARRKKGVFIIEGKREISLALDSNYTLEHILYNASIVEEKELNTIVQRSPRDIVVTQLSQEVYHKLAYRGSTEGIIAVAKQKKHDLSSLETPQNPLILVAEAPEKPGNIGALMRSADAAGVDAFILANPRTDVYNPNIIRSSVGGIFTIPIATGTTDEIIEYLKQNNIQIFSAILQDSQPYHNQNYKASSAIVVGTEATGLTQSWRQHANQNISIPMQGAIDSMNVSVAAGILLYEARRQRGFK